MAPQPRKPPLSMPPAGSLASPRVPAEPRAAIPLEEFWRRLDAVSPR